MKRAIILVVDSLGIGAMSDAPDYGDSLESNTLGNLAKAKGNINLPNFQKLGLGNLTDVANVKSTSSAKASFGALNELSKGKDSTTGHWELAGIVSEKGFDTYPQGFPEEFMNRFISKIGCKGFYGNKPASGTAIIEEFNDQHLETGYPIIYTSADSVFQIATNVSVISMETLYHWCELAREMLDEGYNCSRVIARPYKQVGQKLERISSGRKDYSVLPPYGSILDRVVESGGRVVAVGKIEDLFVGQGVTHSIHTGENRIGLEATIKVLQGKVNYKDFELKAVGSASCELIFINLVDTDMIYGHRRDPLGYASALEEIDRELEKILPLIGPEDLLLITADHGCDPTAAGTDHTREKVPLLVFNPNQEGNNIGEKTAFTYVSTLVADWLGVDKDANWIS